MARKQAIGYEIRRPLTLWGKKRNIGDRLTLDETKSIMRIESLVRAGRINPIFEETDRGEVVKSRTGLVRESLAPAPVKEEVAEEPKPKRGRPVKKAAEGEK